MRRIFRLVPIVLIALSVTIAPVLAQQKLAQTGMKFLNVSGDARASALGEAFTAVEGNAASLFYNPAGIVRLKSFANISLGQTKWIADIKHNFASVALSPANGEYGVVGVFVQMVDYGTLDGTVKWDNAQGYLDLGPFSPRGTAIGLAYARAVTDKFAVGGDVKYVQQNLGSPVTAITGGALTAASSVADLFAFDFGLTYRTGFKSLTFGMVVRNFSKEAEFQKEGFQLPLTFRIGLAMNMADVLPVDKEMHSLLLVVEAEHPRDYAEQIKVGLEYTFMQILSLRAGYVGPADEHGVSYGLGVQQQFGGIGLGLDYGYTPFGILGNVHRFSFQFSI